MNYSNDRILRPIPWRALTSKDKFVVIGVVFLFSCLWVVPLSIKGLLRNEIVGIPLFLPNLVIIPLLFVLNKRKKRGRKGLLQVLLLHFSFCLLGFLLNQYDSVIAHLLVGSYYFYAMFLAVIFKITEAQEYYIAKFFLWIFIGLSVEILLYSLGILTWSNIDIYANMEEYGGVFRFTSTIGNSNLSAHVMVVLGLLVFYYHQDGLLGYTILGLLFAVLLVLVCRGAFLAFLFFAALYLFKKARNFKSALGMIAAALVIISIMNQYHMFDAIAERSDEVAGDVTSGRTERLDATFKTVTENHSEVFGLGFTNIAVNVDMRQFNYEGSYKLAPHNVWVLVYAEQGVIGLTFMVLFWLLALRRIKNDQFILTLTLTILLVLFNTEATTSAEEAFIFPVAYVLTIALSHSERKLSSRQSKRY